MTSMRWVVLVVAVFCLPLVLSCDIANGDCTNPGYEGWTYLNRNCCTIYDYCESTTSVPEALLPYDAYEACCPGACPVSSTPSATISASASSSASVSPSPTPTSETRFVFPQLDLIDTIDPGAMPSNQPTLDFSSYCAHHASDPTCLNIMVNLTLGRDWTGRFGQSFALFPGISFGNVSQMLLVGADAKRTLIDGQQQDTGSVLMAFVKQDLTFDWYWMDVVQDLISGSSVFDNFTVGTNNGFGSAVEIVPDLDGDLIPEIAIGSHFSDGTRSVDSGVDTVQAQGAMFLMFNDLVFVEIKDVNGVNYTLPYLIFKDYSAIGFDNGLAEVPSQKTQVLGVAGDDYITFGRSITAVDLDTDGHPELLVGSPGNLAGYKGDVSIGNAPFSYPGSLYVLSLNNKALDPNLNAGQLRWAERIYPSNITNYGLSATGLEFATATKELPLDLNADTKHEILVSAPGANSNKGALSVLSFTVQAQCDFSAVAFSHLKDCTGTNVVATNLQHLETPPGVTSTGISARTRCGTDIDLIPDRNYDGLPEVAWGCVMRGYNNFGYFDGPGQFQVMSYNVDDSGSQLTLEYYQTTFGDQLAQDPLSPAAGFGFALISLGDVDGDGSNEMLIGAPYQEVGQSESGLIVGMSLRSASPSGTPSVTPSVSPSASSTPDASSSTSPSASVSPSPSVTLHLNTCSGPLQISTCSFSDQDADPDQISGTLSCLNPGLSVYNKSAEFWVAHVTTDFEMGDPFDTNHILLGAWDYNSTELVFSATIKDVNVPFDSNTWYVLVAIVDTQGEGYIGCPFAMVLKDIYRDGTPPKPSNLVFVDHDGTGGLISGQLTFNVTQALVENSTFSIFLATGTGQLSEKIQIASIPYVVGQSEYSLNVTEPLLQTLADNSSFFAGYVWARSATPSRIENYVELGQILSEFTAMHVEDRFDEYYFLTRVSENTGNCPDTSTDKFGVCSSFGVQVATITWRTANTKLTFYEVDGVVIESIDVSDNLVYNIGLGSDSETLYCDLFTFDGGWPAGSPSANWGSQSYSDETTFTLQANFAEFQGCGFTLSSDGLSMTGTIVLEVWQRDHVNSTTPPELRLSANVHISYSDSTHATVRGVFIENVRDAGQVAGNVEVLSVLWLYDTGFLGLRGTSEYISGTDELFVEHRLVSNRETFYLTLERVWFSLGDSIDNRVEFEVEETSSAFTNYDSPAHLGRYRFNMLAPFVMNCRPCHLHVSSLLSTTGSKHLPQIRHSNQKSNSKSFASRALIIGKSTTHSGTPSSHSATNFVILGATALVLARLA